MSEVPATERPNPRTLLLDGLSAIEVVELMAAEEPRTSAAVSAVSDSIAAAAERLADCVVAGGRVVLLGAGTSGRIASAEVAELPPTFGVGAGQFTAQIAGSTGPATIAASEDDEGAAPRELAGAGIGPGDCVLGLAASGTTPFVLAGVRAAARRGAWTCGIANNPETPLLEVGDLGILLDTGPEIIAGSTRLQAATAQKLALNRITTAAMVRAGRVVSNRMADMKVTIAKLRRRAVGIVSDLAAIPEPEAAALLEERGWHVRDALVAAGGVAEPAAATGAIGPAGTTELRTAGPADAGPVRALALAELGRAPSPDRLREILGSYPSVVATEEGALRGFAFGVPLAPDLIDLANLLVAAPYRGAGLGTRLIEGFEHRATGRYRAILVANSGLWPVPRGGKRSAVSLYLRLGYRELYRTGSTTLLHKDLSPRR